MDGQQAYIYQKNNKLVDATISAAVAASARPPLIYPLTKRGNGNIRLYGAFTGTTDARYEIQVLDTALEAPHVSAPVFRGAGTGRISDIIASGLNAQKISVTCLSTGTETTKALVEIEGMIFRAKQAGAAGNAIATSVDDSQLVFTASGFSTIKALPISSTALTGQEWDWGTKVISNDVIPPSAHRVAFGSDRLHIYLQYKKFENGEWTYYFVPEIRYEVPAGTPVWFVTGGRTIYVSDGETTETYAGIVSIANFWQQVQAGSSLIEPAASSIDVSRNPSSPAVREFATKTEAYSLPPYKSDRSSEFAGELTGVKVFSDAKTELIEILCTDASYTGSELWKVKGSSSGELGYAKTGIKADFGHIEFTIPQKLPQIVSTVREDYSWKFTPKDRGAGFPPTVCVQAKLGIASSPQTLTLEYKQQPPSCADKCETITFGDRCLGLNTEGGGDNMGCTAPTMSTWTGTMQEWAAKIAAAPLDAVFSYGRFNIIFSSLQSLATKLSDLEAAGATIPDSLKTAFYAFAKSLQFKGHVLMDIDSYGNRQYINYLLQYTDDAWSVTQSEQTPEALGDLNGWKPFYDLGIYEALWEAAYKIETVCSLKKNDILSLTDASCYKEEAAEYYWEVKGAKNYMPVYTGIPYYSTVKSGEDFQNTREFGLYISKICAGDFIVGDVIEVSLNGASTGQTYQVGDITYLPVVSAQALAFTGGVTGDDLYTFGIAGDINRFPDYSLARTAPLRYYQPELSFQIEGGVIPFQVGDVFEFSIEGGRFVWRKDTGAWSSPLEISNEIQTLDSGLEIAFEFGVTPSFMQNDSWEVLCMQENKVTNLLLPWNSTAWKATGNIDITFASSVTINALIIDRHTLTGHIHFQASNNSDFSGTLIHDEQITVSPLICKLYQGTSAIPAAKYYRLICTGENTIGHIFLGNLMQLSLDADAIRPLKRYQMKRTESKEPFSLLDYTKAGYNVEYSSFIYNSDFEALDTMIGYLKDLNDMPFYFVPNINYPANCLRARIDTDNIEPGSDIDMNAPKDNRLYSLSLPIMGVM